MKPALNLNRLAWVLSKLNEASYASIGVLGCYSRTCSIDGLVEVGWDVGFHRRAILLVCTPPSSSIHSIAGCGTPWVGMAVLVRLLLVEVARAYFVVVAITRGRELRLGVGICIGIVDATLSTVSVRVLLAVGAVCLRVGVMLVLLILVVLL